MTKIKMSGASTLHPLFAAFGQSALLQAAAATSAASTSTSSSSTITTSALAAAAAAAAAAAGSHLSVTITPATSTANSSSTSNNSSHNNNNNVMASSSMGSGMSITPVSSSSSSSVNLNHLSNLIKPEQPAPPPSVGGEDDNSETNMDESPPPSPSTDVNPSSPPPNFSSLNLPVSTAAQLRALASGLSSMIAAANSMNNHNNQQAAAAVAAAAAASKLMEINSNPIDDLVTSGLTQQLLKMNQELWQQGVLNAVNAASGQQQAQAAAVNEIKLAEKLVNELAVQIFMHKSAMQLQQQQQQQAAAVAQQHQQQQQPQQQQVQQHNQLALGPSSGNLLHGANHHQGQLIRAGSSSGSESGALSKPHQCQQCLKSFSSNHQLVQHIRVHTGEKPYKCSYCDRRFKQLSHVQQHTRLHTGERPYKCHIVECGRAFIQLSNLQQHLRNHDAQLERSKNRPFHCNICGKGFATESSLRTHTSKVCKDQHAALIGGPNAVTCPICHKLFLGGEALMEHMKHTHKDPNASGVATKRRTANHPCPVCGKHYVNEGSLRKHLACHPETAQLSSTLRMWPCSVCQAVFTHESGLLSHMEQMRMDPKHQFAAQYVLSRAAAEQREREKKILSSYAAMAAMTGQHPFGGPQGQSSLGSLLPMPASPSGSESSGRLSSPLDTKGGMAHMQHSRMSMSSPVNGPLDARVHSNNNSSNNNNGNSSALPSNMRHFDRKDFEASLMMNNNDETNHSMRDNSHHHHHHGVSHHSHHHHTSGGGHNNSSSSSHHQHNHLLNNVENGSAAAAAAMLQNPQLQDAMKLAAMMGGQGHLGQGGHAQHDLRNLIHHHAQAQAQHGSDMMSAQESMRLQAEALLRSQAAEALRLAVDNGRNNGPHHSASSNNSPNGSSSKEYMNAPGGANDHPNNLSHSMNNSGLNSLSQQQHQQHHEILQQHRNSALDIRMSSSANNSPSLQNGPSNNLHNAQSSSSNPNHPSSHGNLMNNLHNSHHSSTAAAAAAAALNHHQQINALLTQSDLSEALMRLGDARSLGFPLSAHNS